MTDVFSAQKRKEVMTSIRSKNSKAELAVFRYLRKQGTYFQKHYKRALGTPDLALPRKKKAVFIDGDFWHGSRYQELVEKRGIDDYWTKKIAANMKRDSTQRTALIKQGWSILVVEERDLLRKRTRIASLESILGFLQDKKTQ